MSWLFYPITCLFVSFCLFDCLIDGTESSLCGFPKFAGLADPPPALRHMNSDASEDDVFMVNTLFIDSLECFNDEMRSETDVGTADGAE